MYFIHLSVLFLLICVLLYYTWFNNVINSIQNESHGLGILLISLCTIAACIMLLCVLAFMDVSLLNIFRRVYENE